ncbi:MAG TPA: DMT family transporter [Longimicrobiales bacterium]
MEQRSYITPDPAAAAPPAVVRADLGLLVMSGIWAINFSVIKVALADLSPLAFNALRFPLASLMVFLVLRRRGPVPLPRRADLPAIVTLGIIGNVIYQLFFIFGIDRTLAGNAALLLAGSPILTTVFASAIGQERVRPRVWAGVVGTFGGMALVVAGGSGVALGIDTLAGDLIMVAASVAWSTYTVGSKRPIDRYGAVPVTAWTLWIGTPFLFLLGAPDLLALDWAAVRPAAWASIAYAGLFGIGLAYLLWYSGVRHVGNTRTAVYSNVVPVLALLVAWAWLGEVPSAPQIAGAAIIIGGVMLARTGRT